MSKQFVDVLATIERLVFKGTDPIVVALAAGSGEGKTHLWKENGADQVFGCQSRIHAIFGADLPAAIRERVVTSSCSFSDLGTDEHNSKFWRNSATTFGKGAPQFFGHLG